MTNETMIPQPPQARWEFIQSQPDYLAAQEASQAAHLAVREARVHVLQSLVKTERLRKAAELASRQMWKLEGISEKDSEKLRKFTGDCGECWFSDWSNTEDLLEDLAIDSVSVSFELIQTWRDCQGRAKDLQAVKMAAWELLGEVFDTKEATK